MHDQNVDSENVGTILRRALWHAFWLTLWLWLCISSFKQTFVSEGMRHFQLLQSSLVTNGFIVDSTTNDEQLEGGGVAFHHDLVYEYVVKGKRYSGKHTGLPDEGPYVESSPKPVLIEYVPDYPWISRIQGIGPNSFVRWFYYVFIQESWLSIITGFFALTQLSSLLSELRPILRLKIPITSDKTDGL